MQLTQFNDSFKLFPYRKDYADGRTNNGGIDLSREPWRISEITEAKDFPELLELIKDFNMDESPFITLGCEAGFHQGLFCGYVDFTFKQERLANDLGFIAELDENFYTWARQKGSDLESTLRNVLAWEYSPISYHGELKKHKVSFWFRAPDQDYAGKVLNVIRTFFCETLAKSITDASSL